MSSAHVFDPIIILVLLGQPNANDTQHNTTHTNARPGLGPGRGLCCRGDSHSAHAPPATLALRVRLSVSACRKPIIFTCYGKFARHSPLLSRTSGAYRPLRRRRCPARASLQPDSTPQVVWAQPRPINQPNTEIRQCSKENTYTREDGARRVNMPASYCGYSRYGQLFRYPSEASTKGEMHHPQKRSDNGHHLRVCMQTAWLCTMCTS